MRIRLIPLLLIIAASVFTIAPASATQMSLSWEQAQALAPTFLSLEAKAHELALPTSQPNDYLGPWGARRALCIWRELTGRTPSITLPNEDETQAFLTAQRADLQPTARMVPGLNVNITCQSAVWLTANRTIRGIFPVSTGDVSDPKYATRLGKMRIFRSVNGVHRSGEFTNAYLYRALYFYRGAAIHGSDDDSEVTFYPNSAGCVRMLRADVDKLWKARYGIGDTIYTYGRWRNLPEGDASDIILTATLDILRAQLRAGSAPTSTTGSPVINVAP